MPLWTHINRRRRRRTIAVEQLEIRTLLSASPVLTGHVAFDGDSVRVTIQSDTTSTDDSSRTSIEFSFALSAIADTPSAASFDVVVERASLTGSTLDSSGDSLLSVLGGNTLLEGMIGFFSHSDATPSAVSGTLYSGADTFSLSIEKLSAETGLGDSPSAEDETSLQLSFVLIAVGSDASDLVPRRFAPSTQVTESVYQNSVSPRMPARHILDPVEREQNALYASPKAGEGTEALPERTAAVRTDLLPPTDSSLFEVPLPTLSLHLKPTSPFAAGDEVRIPATVDRTEQRTSSSHAIHLLPVADRSFAVVDVESATAAAGLSVTAVAGEQVAIGLAGLVEEILLTIRSALQTIGLAVGADSGGAAPVARTVAPVFPGGGDLRQLEGGVFVEQTILVDPIDSKPFRLSLPGAGQATVESLTIEFAPRHGHLVEHNLATGELCFVPDPGFDGTDSAVWAARLDDGQQVSGAVVFVVDSQLPRIAQRPAVTGTNGRAEDTSVRDEAFSSDELLSDLLR